MTLVLPHNHTVTFIDSPSIPSFQKYLLLKVFQFSKLWYHFWNSSYCVSLGWSLWHALQPRNTQLPKSVISFDQNDLNRERDNNVRWTRPQKRCHQFRWFRTRSRKRCHQFRLEKTSLKQAKHRACLDESTLLVPAFCGIHSQMPCRSLSSTLALMNLPYWYKPTGGCLIDHCHQHLPHHDDQSVGWCKSTLPSPLFLSSA